MPEEKTPAGSIVANPIVEKVSDEGNNESQTVLNEGSQEENKTSAEELLKKYESMDKANQSMIGKQSSEISKLRSQVTELMQKMPQQQQTPNVREKIAALTKAMDSGDIDIATGMQQALDLYGSTVADDVLQKVSAQQKQAKTAEVQGQFLKKNPDYQQVLESGALNSYLDADPLADEYTAYHLYKRDEQIANLQKEYDAKVAAAKEEGAKLAKGAVQAGNVLGKQGSTAAAPQVTKPFTNRQEAEAALSATLKGYRSASAQ